MALQKLLNDKSKLESLQGDESRTRQEIPQTAGCKARACNCCYQSVDSHMAWVRNFASQKLH